jgi:hypothetical protein
LHLHFQKIYHSSITNETLIGTVRCAESTDKNYDFYLFYFPAATKGTKWGQADFVFAKLKGRDWLFEGEIIKWKRPLNFLGFRTAQRPIRIYDSEGNSCLIESKSGEVVFKIAKSLPGIDTSFISILRQPFKPKVKFGIYATNTGYLVRRLK